MNNSNNDLTIKTPKQRSILDLTCDEAKAFLLKQESYCGIDLPPYFRFNDLLTNVANVLKGRRLSDFQDDKARNNEGVNHLILNNKDGRHAWRPLQLIHPAIYVSLVTRLTEKKQWKKICDRFAVFANIEKIKCLSMPVESLTEEKDIATLVTYWWHEIEQKSIELALDYEYIVRADVTDCYSAIYTHSISWAIHGKEKAKKNKRDKDLIGNIIDNHIQDMNHGQTNGIPQGSVLMDFIAEMVLGYADLDLDKTIKEKGAAVTDYLILRYRDDYRIFVNNPQDGEKILKCLTEVMVGLGLKLNAGRTKVCNQVVSESIKPDKLAWMSRKQWNKNLQKHLLIIYDHSMAFSNTGSVVAALTKYYKRLSRRETIQHPMSLISIAVDIAYRNPRTYPICSAILSKLINLLDGEQKKKDVIEKILRRFSQIPNTGHMEIWLQRISLPFTTDIKFKESLCQLAQGTDVDVWENKWISSLDLKDALNAKQIFDRDIAEKIDPIVPIKEVELFMSRNEYY